MRDQGWSVEQIAKALLIDKSTVNRHISDYYSQHKLKDLTLVCSSKLNMAQTENLVAHLEQVTYQHEIK